jgi:RNA polymerase sigma-70 factor, ECF subfamily
MPWAMAIAGWECRTLVKKQIRRREYPAVGHEAGGEHPEQEFVDRSLIAAALDALGKLSDADRETLIATFWEEAASVSGATLRKRRERAVDRLRKTFARLYGLD